MIALHIDRKFTRGRALTSERYAAHNRSVTDTNTLASGNQIVTAHFGWANWLGKRKNIPHGLSAAITVVQAIENHKSGGEGGILYSVLAHSCVFAPDVAFSPVVMRVLCRIWLG